MKSIACTFLFIALFIKAYPQCTSGNCVTGSGTYNFGWCIYTGEFKNGKPEGKGSMQYDDYVYTGQFKNGLEDGEGIIVGKNGDRENVIYKAGKKVTSGLVRVDAKDYKPIEVQNVNCLDGNCNTGYGTYQFSSGNKYTGNFKDQRFEGEGRFVFANGDKFEGTFHNNEKVSGTYHYFTGASYAGTYYGNGLEADGEITSPQGMKIKFVGGKPIIPPPPKPVIPMGADLRGDIQARRAPEKPVKMFCLVCAGTGVQRHVEDWSSPTVTHLVSVATSCYKCHGTGVD